MRRQKPNAVRIDDDIEEFKSAAHDVKEDLIKIHKLRVEEDIKAIRGAGFKEDETKTNTHIPVCSGQQADWLLEKSS